VRDVLSKGGKINVYDHGGNLAQQGITELHEFHIPQDTLFREREIDPAISDASRILDGHIRDGRRVVLSSDLGGRRTAATLYFLFRRGGNTHEEALQHTQQVLKRANTWRDDMFKVYKKKWWHLKNIDEFALLREGGDKL
jgi:hypothetical protein